MASEPASVCRPPGLLYLCMKHVTDRYNMYYSYAPTKLNEQIHMAAIHQAIFAPLLGLVWMLFFSILRLGMCRAPPATPPLSVPPPLSRPSPTTLVEADQALGGARCSSWSTATLSAFCRPRGLVLESQLTLEVKGSTGVVQTVDISVYNFQGPRHAGFPRGEHRGSRHRFL